MSAKGTFGVQNLYGNECKPSGMSLDFHQRPQLSAVGKPSHFSMFQEVHNFSPLTQKL